MRPKWLAAALVFAVAAGIVVWRESRRPAVPASVPASPATGSTPRVVLYADLSEVDEAEGCGAIIRGVRDARGRGVAAEEIDTRERSDAPARYRLLLAPTVLVLDGSGREQRRFEGESPETVRAIQAELRRLAATR